MALLSFKLALLLQLFCLSAYSTQYSHTILAKSPDQKCYRDEECQSNCCYQQICMQTLRECASRRQELLMKILSHMQQDHSIEQYDDPQQQAAEQKKIAALVDQATIDFREKQTNQTQEGSDRQNEEESYVLSLIRNYDFRSENLNQAINSEDSQYSLFSEEPIEDESQDLNLATSSSDPVADISDKFLSLQQDSLNQVNTVNESNQDLQNSNSQQQLQGNDEPKNALNKEAYNTGLVIIFLLVILGMMSMVVLALRGDSFQMRLKEKHWLYDQQDSQDDQYIRLI